MRRRQKLMGLREEVKQGNDQRASEAAAFFFFKDSTIKIFFIYFLFTCGL